MPMLQAGPHSSCTQPMSSSCSLQLNHSITRSAHEQQYHSPSTIQLLATADFDSCTSKFYSNADVVRTLTASVNNSGVACEVLMLHDMSIMQSCVLVHLQRLYHVSWFSAATPSLHRCKILVLVPNELKWHTALGRAMRMSRRREDAESIRQLRRWL